jgi:predicted DNA-binding antitoxin AbrB/MazE fold protein
VLLHAVRTRDRYEHGVPVFKPLRKMTQCMDVELRKLLKQKAHRIDKAFRPMTRAIVGEQEKELKEYANENSNANSILSCESIRRRETRKIRE